MSPLSCSLCGLFKISCWPNDNQLRISLLMISHLTSGVTTFLVGLLVYRNALAVMASIQPLNFPTKFDPLPQEYNFYSCISLATCLQKLGSRL